MPNRNVNLKCFFQHSWRAEVHIYHHKRTKQSFSNINMTWLTWGDTRIKIKINKGTKFIKQRITGLWKLLVTTWETNKRRDIVITRLTHQQTEAQNQACKCTDNRRRNWDGPNNRGTNQGKQTHLEQNTGEINYQERQDEKVTKTLKTDSPWQHCVCSMSINAFYALIALKKI